MNTGTLKSFGSTITLISSLDEGTLDGVFKWAVILNLHYEFDFLM